MSDISLKSSYARCTPGKKSKYINARGKETEAVPISWIIQGQTTAHSCLHRKFAEIWSRVGRGYECTQKLSCAARPYH